jgi:5'-3' exonuclease
MPMKSIGLLPASYATIAKSERLRGFFPMDFDIDLNGRALPWEAACLIPFVEESLFISHEEAMLSQSPLNPEDARRN